MEQYEFVCPCHFGLESVLKQEILDLGYEIVQVEDGKVTFPVMLRHLHVQTYFCVLRKGYFGK